MQRKQNQLYYKFTIYSKLFDCIDLEQTITTIYDAELNYDTMSLQGGPERCLDHFELLINPNKAGLFWMFFFPLPTEQ